jgi:hypothetical protein
MTIVDRVLQLDLPLDDIVVIGSGLLDALQLRQAHDIDLVVSDAFFAQLKASGEYKVSVKHGEQVLERDDIEIWQTWGNGQDETFEALRRSGVVLQSVTFCSPGVLLRHKRARATAKDLRDVALLENYLDKHPL